MFETISWVATAVVAVAAGLGYFSFWWCLIPTFLTGSFMIANHEGAFGAVLKKNSEGNLWFFPLMLCVATGTSLLVAAVIYGIVYGITSFF